VLVAHACNPSGLKPEQVVHETLSRKKLITKKGLAEWLKWLEPLSKKKKKKGKYFLGKISI
jgi:hypothetical protein